MRKNGLLICFVIIAMLITGCGSKTTVPPLELPDTEEITAVKVITIDGFSCSCSDREWIGQFVSVISSAQTTDKAAIQEHPASNYYGEFIILSGEEVIECIYYYAEDCKTYIEKTYQGIYEIEMEKLKNLIGSMKE